MLTGKQVVALSELLHSVRPDWDTRGIQAALRRVDPDWAWPATCIHAIETAARATNLTPDTIAWRTPTTTRPVNHGEPCPTHTGTIRRADGTWHCCWIADQDPPEPYRRTGVHPPPPGLADTIRATIAETQRPDPSPGAGIGTTKTRDKPDDWLEQLAEARAELDAIRPEHPSPQTREPSEPVEAADA